MDAGEAALKALQSDLDDLKETVEKLISRGSSETAKSAREVAGQVSAAASDIAERGAHVASAAADQAKTLVTELENIVRRNPPGALAGSVVVGILIGMMGASQLMLFKIMKLFGIDLLARMAEVRVDLEERFDLARDWPASEDKRPTPLLIFYSVSSPTPSRGTDFLRSALLS
jgi:ElaB/YqjD/DUF883 family membrane-anchored ribosome-binding protein